MRDKAAITTDVARRKELMYEAYNCIQKALSLDDQIFAVHKVNIC